MEKRLDTDRLKADGIIELSRAAAASSSAASSSAASSSAASSSAASSSAEAEDAGQEASSDDMQRDAMQLDPRERLGRSLQDKREDLEMGLEEIVRTTKIPKTSLGHIEAGRFESLPGDVFARGFLRSYARCLGLDGDDVVRRYAQCGLSPAPVSSELADAVLGSRRKTKPRRARGTTASTRSSDWSTKQEAVEVTDAFSTGFSGGKSAKSEDATGSADGNAVRKVLRDALDLGLQMRNGLGRDGSGKSSSGNASAGESACSVPAASEEVAADCKSVRERRDHTFIPPSLDYDSDMTHRGPLTLGVIVLVIVATLTMSYLLRRPGTSTDGFTLNQPELLDSQDSLARGETEAALIFTLAGPESSSHSGLFHA
ncbi:MAG: helix-turn-helix domain-containing protein [Myxococcales bacterium]|nr:helix-turn-helix domain-containing protein [Myxococcales bacterium]